MPICANCGQENPDVARFCLACGAALAVEAPREERKVVSVLFADLVGFTSRAERMDPEDVRALLSPYYARLRTELERFGGTVEKFIGDAVMALFGAPVAHEDDPERAVRAALAIRDWVIDEQQELQVRIAVTTGEALIALGAHPSEGEGMASGDVVNTAARLQAAAPVNGILVDGATCRATTDAIVYEEAEPVSAKGKAAALAVWRAVEPRSRVGVERGHDAPLVGRAEELALLVEALARAKRESTPQLVTVVGVPGIGKSRLVYELYGSVEAGGELVTWRHGRALPYGEAVTFWPVAEMVKAQAGILESDSSEDAETKLGYAVRALQLPDGDWVETHLRPLTGLGGESQVAEERRIEAFAAWRRFFEALAESRPLVLVFEDLHWADDGVLDFVDHLAEWVSGVPMLLVCTARPELLTRRPGWGGGKANATTISLSPLSDEQTAKLLGTLLQRSVLPVETQSMLLAVAAGNPLYAEQYARMLAETGRVDELTLPETVQGIIAARMDALSPDEKVLLQDASVVGRGFWLGAVATIGERDRFQTELLLHALQRKEFVRRERRSSVSGEDEFTFRHLLVRDVAYGQIPRAERADKHRRAAEWIESLGRPEDHAETLAQHYLIALELSEAAGRATAPLQDPARHAFRTAAERAAALFAYPTALKFYELAAGLWPGDDAERAELLFRRAETAFLIDKPLEPLLEAQEALLRNGLVERAAEAEILIALALWSRDHSSAAHEHTARAAQMVATAPPSRAKAFVLANRARLLAVNDDSAEALEIARDALALADSLGLDELRAHALNTIGLGRLGLDDFDGIDDLEESLHLALAHGTPFELTRIYNNLGWGYVYAGRLQAGRETFEAGLETARRFGLRDQAHWAAVVLAVNLEACGRWDEALALVEDVLEDLRETDTRGFGPFAIRALIRLGRGDVLGGRADLEQAAALRPPEDSVIEQAIQLSIQIQGLVGAGRRQEADVLGDELSRIFAPALEIAYAFDVLDVAFALWELDRPIDELADSAAAHPARVWHQVGAMIVRGELVGAADRLGDLGAHTLEAYVRLRAAEQLGGEGDASKAEAQLERALEFYRSVGATYFVRRGETLLAATA